MADTHVYLRKANDEFICYCECDPAEALITYPAQLDCPWCGCGWLFSCLTCRKAFTFAEAFETDTSWQELAHQDLQRRTGSSQIGMDERAEWEKFMAGIMLGIEIGNSYVYFDGRIINVDRPAVDYEGLHGTHKLDFVPQLRALEDPSVMHSILSNTKYWQRAARTA